MDNIRVVYTSAIDKYYVAARSIPSISPIASSPLSLPKEGFERIEELRKDIKLTESVISEFKKKRKYV